MKLKLSFAAAFALAALALPVTSRASSQPEPPQEENVIFFEDFNGPESVPNPEIWKLCSYSHTVWGRYFANTEGYSNVKIEDGYLVLTADKKDGNYTTGGIRTIKGFPAGTKLEVKARLKPLKGAFPAIWQMPVGGRNWPESGEVDVMEWVQGSPDCIHQTLHTSYIYRTIGDAGYTRKTAVDVTEEHIYAAARAEEAVIFYIDGVETSRYDNAHLEGSEGKLQFPFVLWDYDIILNFSLGGEFNGGKTWAGPIDDEELPGVMWIDWVKVSKIE